MNAFLTPAEGNKASPFIESAIPNETEWYGETIDGLRWSIYQGDAEKVLGRIAEESVNCVVTSPPYYWLRDYGVEGQIGWEETVEGYVAAISNVMDQVKRVLRKNGVLFLNIGDT